MTSERWRKIEALFHAAQGLNANGRQAFLANSGQIRQIRGQIRDKFGTVHSNTLFNERHSVQLDDMRTRLILRNALLTVKLTGPAPNR